MLENNQVGERQPEATKESSWTGSTLIGDSQFHIAANCHHLQFISALGTTSYLIKSQAPEKMLPSSPKHESKRQLEVWTGRSHSTWLENECKLFSPAKKPFHGR